jgi:myotubularin-related protein 1/2
LNIENIHVIRESYRKVQSLSQPSVKSAHDHWLSNLANSHWMDHQLFILKGAKRIVQLVEGGNPVLIHCSDGWDRYVTVKNYW